MECMERAAGAVSSVCGRPFPSSASGGGPALGKLYRQGSIGGVGKPGAKSEGPIGTKAGVSDT